MSHHTIDCRGNYNPVVVLDRWHIYVPYTHNRLSHDWQVWHSCIICCNLHLLCRTSTHGCKVGCASVSETKSGLILRIFVSIVSRVLKVQGLEIVWIFLMQATVVTSFRSAVKPRRTLHVEGERYTLFIYKNKFYKNNEAQMYPKIKNNWASASHAKVTASFCWKTQRITSLHVHFIAGLSAVRNTEWAEKKIKTVPHMFHDSAEVYIRQQETYTIEIKLTL